MWWYTPDWGSRRTTVPCTVVPRFMEPRLRNSSASRTDPVHRHRTLPYGLHWQFLPSPLSRNVGRNQFKKNNNLRVSMGPTILISNVKEAFFGWSNWPFKFHGAFLNDLRYPSFNIFFWTSTSATALPPFLLLLLPTKYHAHHNMPRNFLINQQKGIVKKEIDRRQTLHHQINLDEIAEWAQQFLKISFKPSKPVLSLLRLHHDVQDHHSGN